MDFRDDELDLALREMYRQPVPPSFEAKWTGAVRREERIQMNKKSIWKWSGWSRIVLPVAAALVVLVGAGWAGNLEFSGSNMASDSMKQQPMVAYSRSSNAKSDAVAMDYGAAEESYDAGYSTMTVGGGLTGNYAAKESAAQPTERKLVRTVSLTMRTGNYEQDLSAIQELVASVGGYEEYHYESGDVASGDSRYVEMTLRSPADQLDTFLGSVGGIGRVVNRSENVVDRTTEYTDNETRLNTLNTKMARLQELLEKAENVDDLLSIENQIADTQYDIDRLTSWQLGIDRQVDMSTVTINLREEKPTEIAPEMTFGEKIVRAVKASWEGFVQFLKNAVVFLIMAIPAVLTIGVIVAVVVLIRKGRKKAAAKRAEETNEE